jgi:hypothetical protein
MKSYSFAKVSARGYLTEADYNNKYILTEDLRLIINVSGRDFERPQEFFQERNITARFMPLTEKNGDMREPQQDSHRGVPLRQDRLPSRR